MKRRDFLTTAAVGAAAVLSGKSSVASAAVQETKYNFKLATVWPSRFPVFHSCALRFARHVDIVTDGRIKINVYSAGSLAPAMELFDAVSQGKADIGAGFSSFWTEKTPAARWFSSIPFGLNSRQMNAWIYSGDGLKLWEKAYEPFNLTPRLLGSTGGRMGGWFNKKIEKINDFNGLRIRMPGVGGNILSKFGSGIVSLSGGEVFSALRSGKVDAVDWGGPYLDLNLGLNKVARYYYYPGWQDPGTAIELIFNKETYDALPDDLKTALDTVAMETNLWCSSEFEALNSKALDDLINRHNVKVVRFPDAVLKELKAGAEQEIMKEAEKDELCREINESYTKFNRLSGRWGAVSDGSILSMI